MLSIICTVCSLGSLTSAPCFPSNSPAAQRVSVIIPFHRGGSWGWERWSGLSALSWLVRGWVGTQTLNLGNWSQARELTHYLEPGSFLGHKSYSKRLLTLIFFEDTRNKKVPFIYHWTGGTGSNGMKGEGSSVQDIMKEKPSYTPGKWQASRFQVLLWAVCDLRVPEKQLGKSLAHLCGPGSRTISVVDNVCKVQGFPLLV